MSDQGVKRAAELVLATAEAFEAGGDLERAVIAAAQLLAGCTCQDQRLPQAVATIELCQQAVKRWQIANGRMMRIAMKAHGMESIQ